MKLKLLFTGALTATLIGFAPTASAGFSGPFDFWDNDDDYYRYGGPGIRRDRWRRYDEWEPNYWRYRYFEDDSDDYIFDDFDDFDGFDGFDDFDGDFMGDGRFDFNMNMEVEGDSEFDGDWDDDYRYGDRRYRRYDRPQRPAQRPAPRSRGFDRPARRDYEAYQAYKRDRYRRSAQRRMSDTPEQQRRREQRRVQQPAECR